MSNVDMVSTCLSTGQQRQGVVKESSMLSTNGVLNDEYCWVSDNQNGRESIRMDETTNPKTCTGGEPHVYYMPLAQLCLLSLHPAGRHRHARATA